MAEGQSVREAARAAAIETKVSMWFDLWFLGAVSAAFVYLWTDSFVSAILVAVYIVSIRRIQIGRKLRLAADRDERGPRDHYTYKRRGIERSIQDRLSMVCFRVLSLTTAPAHLVWAFLSNLSKPKVPGEYILTVASSRNHLRAAIIDVWVWSLVWIAVLGAAWQLDPTARPVVGLLLLAVYFGMCFMIVGMGIAPYSTAQRIKASALRSPLLAYWILVPVIVVSVWSAAYLVSVAWGGRTLCREDALSSMSAFVQYKGLVKVSNFLASRVVEEPVVIVELVPALCVFLLIVPGVFRIREFKRSDDDWLRQAQLAVNAVRPEVANRAIDQVRELIGSTPERELRVAALCQSGEFNEAVKEMAAHPDSDGLAEAGVSVPTQALVVATQYPGDKRFRDIVEQWLDTGPTPLEILYSVCEQDESSEYYCFAICAGVSTPKRAADDQMLSAVLWWIARARAEGDGRWADGGGARSIGWLHHSFPASLRFLADHAYCISSEKQAEERVATLVARSRRIAKDASHTSNRLDAYCMTRILCTSLPDLPKPLVDIYMPALDVLADRYRSGKLASVPPYSSTYMSQMIAHTKRSVESASSGG